jgi:hypothetical protein
VFVPNGDPVREERDPSAYHQLWGRVHPLLLTPAALEAMAARNGLMGSVYSAPYDLDAIRARRGAGTEGDELLCVASRPA